MSGKLLFVMLVSNVIVAMDVPEGQKLVFSIRTEFYDLLQKRLKQRDPNGKQIRSISCMREDYRDNSCIVTLVLSRKYQKKVNLYHGETMPLLENAARRSPWLLHKNSRRKLRNIIASFVKLSELLSRDKLRIVGDAIVYRTEDWLNNKDYHTSMCHLVRTCGSIANIRSW